MSVLHVTKEQFENQLLTAEQTVLLDFWASWCGPCKMMSPVIDQAAQERPDVIVGKVNVDEQPELAARFGIMSIPTLIVLKNGEIINKQIGYCSLQQVLGLLD